MNTDSSPWGRRALVLLTDTYANGGIQRFNRTFLAACGCNGVPCDVLSLGLAPQSGQHWQEPTGVRVRTFQRDKARFARAVGAAILRGNHDLLVIGHVNFLVMAGLFLLFLPRRRRPRVFFIAHGIEVWEGLGSGVRRRALRCIDTLLCVSRYTRDAIRRQVPEIPKDRFSIFPNALGENWGRHRSESRHSGAAEEAVPGLPGRFLLSVTRLDSRERYKGITTVLEALPLLHDPSLHYVIAGSGDDQDFLAAMAVRLGIGERVHFLGTVSDGQLQMLYRSCLAFVLPSDKEGFGIVFLEAMFFGACVVGASEKGTLDVIEHDRNGMLVPFGDAQALKQAIDRLVADAELRERLRDGGRAVVTGEGRFTFGAFSARLGRVLTLPSPSP